MENEQVLICYRGACNNAAHPCGYNRVTHGLYCIPCARLIGSGPNPELKLFPLLESRKYMRPGGSRVIGNIVIRPQPENSK